jgi:hypothetical protein
LSPRTRTIKIVILPNVEVSAKATSAPQTQKLRASDERLFRYANANGHETKSSHRHIRDILTRQS